MAVQNGFRHRPTLKQRNKPHKKHRRTVAATVQKAKRVLTKKQQREVTRQKIKSSKNIECTARVAVVVALSAHSDRLQQPANRVVSAGRRKCFLKTGDASTHGALVQACAEGDFIVLLVSPGEIGAVSERLRLLQCLGVQSPFAVLVSARAGEIEEKRKELSLYMQSCFHMPRRAFVTQGQGLSEVEEDTALSRVLCSTSVQSADWKRGRAVFVCEKMARIAECQAEIHAVYRGGSIGAMRRVHCGAAGEVTVLGLEFEDGSDRKVFQAEHCAGQQIEAEEMQREEPGPMDVESDTAETEGSGGSDESDETMASPCIPDGYRNVPCIKRVQWDSSDVPAGYGDFLTRNKYAELVRQQTKSSSQSEATATLRVVGTPAQIEQLVAGALPVLTGLLNFEDRESVGHYLITIDKNHREVVDGEQFVFCIGCRQFSGRALLATHVVGKTFLWTASCAAGASIVMVVHAPVCYGGGVVVLSADGTTLVGHGTIMEYATDSVVLERMALCGRVRKPKGRKVIVRGMFSSAAEVKSVGEAELVTRRGLRGHVKGSVGTHGRMKCVFNKKIREDDSVMMQLCRRVFPHPSLK